MSEIGVVRAQTDPKRRVALLEGLIASERAIRDHPLYGIGAARLMAEARHELAILKAQSDKHPRRVRRPL